MPKFSIEIEEIYTQLEVDLTGNFCFNGDFEVVTPKLVKIIDSLEEFLDSNNFKEMFHYIHKNGNIYDGLAYLYSICKEDNELNKYIMTQINYDTNNNSLNSAKLHSMNMIARNNFEKKYKELLGEYTMFTVEKKLLELEENEIEKYYDLKYNKETKELNWI